MRMANAAQGLQASRGEFPKIRGTFKAGYRGYIVIYIYISVRFRVLQHGYPDVMDISTRVRM